MIARWIPPQTAGARVGDRVDDRADRRGQCAAAGRADPGALRLAASFFVFGFLGVIWAAVWYAWFRDSPAEKPGVTAAELQEIGAAPAGQPRPALGGRRCGTGMLWRIAAIGACYVYALGFFQVVAADLSGQGTRLHGGGAGAVLAAVRRWCLRQRLRRSRSATGWFAGLA